MSKDTFGSNDELTQQIVSAVESGAAAEALSRALDISVEMEVGEVAPWEGAADRSAWDVDGTALAWCIGESGTLLLVPDFTGLLGSGETDGTWSEPIASRMNELARDLARLMAPDESAVETARAEVVCPLSKVFHVAHLDDSAMLIRLKLRAGGTDTVALVMGPVRNPIEVIHQAKSQSSNSSEQLASQVPPSHANDAEFSPGQSEEVPEQSPAYNRSLMKIQLPIIVTLASKKQTVAEISRLVPGNIIQFAKSCDEVLELEVANQRIAVGEAVKVNDNFGLRITSIIPPEERFRAV